jgi:hypothetical protein
LNKESLDMPTKFGGGVGGGGGDGGDGGDGGYTYRGVVKEKLGEEGPVPNSFFGTTLHEYMVPQFKLTTKP